MHGFLYSGLILFSPAFFFFFLLFLLIDVDVEKPCSVDTPQDPTPDTDVHPEHKERVSSLAMSGDVPAVLDSTLLVNPNPAGRL